MGYGPGTQLIQETQTVPQLFNQRQAQAPGQIFADENTLDIARQSPSAALAAYRRARGQTGRDKSLYGGYREQQMGQAVQAFNLVHGLPETAGLEQLPLAP